jgi:hypothetical protein
MPERHARDKYFSLLGLFRGLKVSEVLIDIVFSQNSSLFAKKLMIKFTTLHFFH